jgi:hypothetical protein
MEPQKSSQELRQESSHDIRQEPIQESSQSVFTDAMRYKMKLEYTNGFGFQFPQKGTVAPICLLNECFDGKYQLVKPNYEELVKEIKIETGCKSLDWNYYIGRAYFQIDWLEEFKSPKIEAILNALIQRNMNFQLTTQRLPAFGPREGDNCFTMSMIEPRLVKNLRHAMDNFEIDLLRSLYQNESVADIWNWKTREGQETCKKLRKKLFLPEQDSNDPENFRNWECYTNFEEWSKTHEVSWWCF